MYTRCFLLTCILEILVVVVFFLITGANVKKLLFVCLAMIVLNVITHPWAYYLVVHGLVSVPIIEFAVVVAEAVLWKVTLVKSWKAALLVAFITNVSSYFTGRFL